MMRRLLALKCRSWNRERCLLLALLGPREMSDLSPQSGPMRDIDQIAVTHRDFMSTHPIMVHGCFWHQHPGCRLARAPKSRLEYWLPKLRRNQERDEEAIQALRAQGYVLVLWECQAAAAEIVGAMVGDFLGDRSLRRRRMKRFK